MKPIQWLTGLVFLCIALSSHTLYAQTAALFVTDQNGIHRVDLEGKVAETVIPVMLREPGDLTVDESSGKIYLADFDSILGEGLVQRTNLDGSGAEFISVTGMGKPLGIAIDPEAGKMYWAETETKGIFRANLDGSEPENLVTGTAGNPAGIALDLDNGKMYWTELTSSAIMRANLDGTEVETLVMYALGAPRYIALDIQSGKMYWADESAFSIRRANLDGTGMETLISTTARPSGISLDLATGTLFWTELPTFGAPRKLRRTNLDGSDPVDIIATTGAFFPQSITFDPETGQVYWIDDFRKKIQRAPTDGSAIEDVINAVTSPWGIALDVEEGKMYWSDLTTNKIQRANLDGTEVEDVFTELYEIAGIVLDTQNDLIYWAKAQNIERGALDGTGIENVVSELGFVFSIAVDPFSEVIYWTDEGFFNVQQANLDGTGLIDLIPGHGASDVEHDPEQGALYLVSWDRIQRFDLATAALEDVVVAERGGGLHLTLDLSSETMYWIDFNSESGTVNSTIRRANLDGTEIEDILAIGLRIPRDIALLPGTTIGSSNEEETPALHAFTLTESYPNPFRSTTTFTYTLSQASAVDIRVYDLLGREVDVVGIGTRPAGQHEVSWNGEGLPAGLYLLKATTENGLHAVRTLVKVE